ncbi:MAG: hypothetical protein ABRQ25_09950 [Clostridiaceae bacterium]
MNKFLVKVGTLKFKNKLNLKIAKAAMSRGFFLASALTNVCEENPAGN